MKFSEKQIQEYIWQNKEEWANLFEDVIYPELVCFDGEEGLDKVNAENLLHNLLIEKIININEKVKELDLIGIEVPLGATGTSKIRADFLATRDGDTGIYIIELKKSKQTERESFTELLAYSNHLNFLFPSHCIDDTILVLIAPLSTRTVEAAFLQSLLFDRKQICILQPHFLIEDDISSLKLKPYIPRSSDVKIFLNAAFSKRNFDVEVVVWSTVQEFWNPIGDPDDHAKKQMNRVSSIAAQFMEAKSIHGFVYSQQTWPELEDLLPFRNKLIMVALNPYRVANDYFHLTNFPGIKVKEIPEISLSSDAVNLTDIIPGLKNKSRNAHNDWNYFGDLGYKWGAHLLRIGKKTVEFANLNRINKNVDIDMGSAGTWDKFEVNQLENVFTFNFEVRTTGLIDELYRKTTEIDFKFWQQFKRHPYQGDSFAWALDNAASHWLFEIFLNRMFLSSNIENDHFEE